MVRAMKIKSHTSKWAIALCAFAVFSFTAHAGKLTDQAPAPTIAPATETDAGVKTLPPIAPVPPTQPPVDNGTFNGTVVD
jgi:hypothetical protein